MENVLILEVINNNNKFKKNRYKLNIPFNSDIYIRIITPINKSK